MDIALLIHIYYGIEMNKNNQFKVESSMSKLRMPNNILFDCFLLHNILIFCI